MSVAKLMTNILPRYYEFLEKETRRKHKTKREIIEEAIELYMAEKKKKAIAKQYESMADDSDYLIELQSDAQMGIDYFLDDLNEPH